MPTPKRSASTKLAVPSTKTLRSRKPASPKASPKQTKTLPQVFTESGIRTSLSDAKLSSFPLTTNQDPTVLQREASHDHILPDPMEEDDKYVTDPDFSTDFVAKVDEHIKIMILAMMCLATLIMGIFFYYYHHLPKEIFAAEPIKNIFLPQYYWSGIHFQILCPWAASFYCLVVVVYPDPRFWRFCLKPRRTMRWIPYLTLLAYTVIINAFWVHELFFIPRRIRSAMQNSIRESLRDVTTHFPPSWEFVQNYYQCCGIEGKYSWRNKIIPTTEIPYPYKTDTTCKIFYYGRQQTSKDYNCSNGNPSELGERWPASCCDNSSRINNCTTLPSSTNLWTNYCYTQEVALAISTVAVVMILAITIDILGAFAFFKTRILETIALRQKLKPPASHI